MFGEIKAVAFDIDGTLYPSFSLYIRLVPYIIRHLKFYLHYNKVRRIMHRTAPLPDFYEYQARLMAEDMGCSAAEAREQIKKIAYDGLRPYFEKIKPFKNALEVFKKLHEKGFKLALLSDFPPSQKGDIWGIIPYCDLILGTEEIGALKPSKYPFGILAIGLELEPSQILYVGNSIKFDVRGAKNAGMKAAIIASPLKRIFSKKIKEADISFSNYRQFLDIVL
ncbi:MAG: HAD family hydrolase [Treponema sp.]|uniref:HAD family hydrolase n=1 Tax=Treponema sp. TaxID=166 RepID=UPI001B0F33A7|nr:HAD family hydrolase [Treponema sp.]MBO6218974.1 HAD family hydrolase [Treponema sp.]MBQ8679422.1 HAD family hydrolase [Treponema sp.]